MGLISKTTRQPKRFSFGQNQIVPVAGRELIFRGETDRSFGTGVGALGTEQAATEVDLQTSIAGNCISRASIDATRATRFTSCLIQDW